MNHVRDTEPIIAVGIHTDGSPETYGSPDGLTVVANALIGVGFHWQRRVPLTFAGTMCVAGTPDCGISLINRLPLELYLESVVSSEMNPQAPAELLRAHAIISRSWALGKILHTHTHSSEGKKHTPGDVTDWEDTGTHSLYDVCNDDHCQRYQGVGAVTRRAAEAVRSTRGMVLTDRNGDIADARFSKCCGGHTEYFSTCWQPISPDYLQPVSDPWCDPAGLTPEELDMLFSQALKGYDSATTTDYYQWTGVVHKDSLARRASALAGQDIGDITSIAPLHRGVSGRIDRLLINGSLHSLTVGKELTIRRLLSKECLKSSTFDITDAGDVFELKGRGWGHGVGLCQIGAAVQAMRGRKAEDILSYYYPTASIAYIYDDRPDSHKD